MLFNSFEFIVLFLPFTLLAFYLAGNLVSGRLAMLLLVISSLFYYGWWNPNYLVLILSSIIFNFCMGKILGNQNRSAVFRKSILIFSITANLLTIGYFKYANFFVDNVNFFTGSTFHLEKIILPLAISFFTFQQITYIVDSYQGYTKEYQFLNYCLFVTFFPQLIAGPIVHHKEMMPQFTQPNIYRLNFDNLANGFCMFLMGLAKKILIADTVGADASRIFSISESGQALDFFTAWQGALAYTFQLYFDFSGYSDMAIGIGLMFGIKLPLNFNSPYKASNIIDFWRCWHITLSRFLKDYVYIPLGGNRKGKFYRYVNLMLTMLIGGLWHGAGWTFIFWGALHGFYLIINHGWNYGRKKLGHDLKNKSPINSLLGIVVTFLCVVVGWVLFRSESISGAANMYNGMIGLNGIGSGALVNIGLSLQILICGVFVWFFPNTQIFMKYLDKPQEKEYFWTSKFRFSYNNFYVIYFTVILILCYLAMNARKGSEFLYYDF